MKVATRMSAYVGGLAVILGVSVLVGAAFGPAPKTNSEEPPPIGMGVVQASNGYRFEPSTRSLPETATTFRFKIEGPSGRVTTKFTPTHKRLLHLIVVSRDLTVYHHVHPALSLDGTWSIDLAALPPGSYRAIADFKVTGGPHLALGTDLDVAGDYQPGRLQPVSLTDTVDGYQVDLVTKRSKGGEVRFSLTVNRDGQPVVLEQYLGAAGHLIAIRAGDLAYAHVHPLEIRNLPGHVVFDSMLDSAGRYGLFFDFKNGGVVHTARFTFDQGLVTGTSSMKE